MINQSVLVGLIGALSALAGVFVGGYFQRRHEEKRWARDDARWRADPYRTAKFEALRNLHLALMDCGPSKALHSIPSKDVKAKADDIFYTLHQTSLVAAAYLSESEFEAIGQVLEGHRGVSARLVEVLEDSRPDLSGSTFRAYEKALEDFGPVWKKTHDALRETLNPTILLG